MEPPDAGPDCVALAQPCFVGVSTASGCRFDYKCPSGTVCVAPNNNCVAAQAPAPGFDHATCTANQTCQAGDCYVMTHNQRTYMLCNGFADGSFGGWNASRTYCQQQWPGFDLVSIRDADEQAFIPTLLVYGQAWIGFTDRTDINFNTVEGRWVWSDGAVTAAGVPVPWTVPPGTAPWCNGKPNGGTGENCATASGAATNGCWDDQTCTNPHAYICAR